MQTNHDGRRVPNTVTIHVVREVSIAVAVNGWIHVVGVLDERIKRSVGFLNDLVNSVLTGNRIFSSRR